jgi:hypothetical protein
MQETEVVLSVLRERGRTWSRTRHKSLESPVPGKRARRVCAVRRFVVSPAQPGGTRREVPGSPDLPRGESPMGTRACQGRGGRLEASRAGHRKIRTIRPKLDCLKPNPQR